MRSGKYAWAIALFVASVLYLMLCMDRTVGPYDESLTLFAADRVMIGDVPHRDFYELYGPAQLYALAGLFRVFGPSVLVERIWTVAVSSAIVAMTFLLVSAAAPRWNAVVAAIASLLWFQTTKGYGLAVIPAAAAMLASLLFLLPCLQGRSSPGRLLAAGICTGIAALCRYDMGGATLGAECLLLTCVTWLAPQHRTLPAVATFAAGFGLVVVPVAIALVLCGAVRDLVFDVFVFPSGNYARTRSLPFPGRSILRDDPVEFIGVYLPLALCATALFALIRSWPFKSARAWATAGVTILVLICYAKGYVRVSVNQLMTALVLAMPLAALVAQPIPGRDRGRRILTGIVLLIAAATTLASVPGAVVQARRNIAWASDPRAWQLTDASPIAGSCHMPAGLERMACFPVSPEDAATIRYVQQHTGSNEPVFVGLSRHDKIFVNNVLLYFAIGRRSVTKWHHFDPGLQTSALIQSRMVTELMHQKPPLIVLVNQWADIKEPNDSALSSGVTLLDDYIARTYVPVATFGVNTVLRMKGNELDAG